LGVSVDSVPCLTAWADSLGGINYPLVSDFYPHGALTSQFGVLRKEGYSERALFIIDKQGVVRYVDVHDIDDQPDNDVLLAELRRIDPQAAARAATTVSQPSALPTGGIIMYCTSWCPNCRRARRFLEERGLAYTEINIDSTPEARTRLRELTGGTLTTPTFDIDGKIMVDFDRDRLREMLDQD
jgi:glutaredoxin